MSGPRYWALIPAAGSGQRMGAAVPKQYLQLCGKPIIQHTVERISGNRWIAGTVVVLAAADPHWSTLKFEAKHELYTTPGGNERCHSVLAGLQLLSDRAAPSDWVLVHDAARPCLRAQDIDALISGVADHLVGGVLGVPVRDTMKRVNSGDEVVETVDRSKLWHALTPQMFRLAALKLALESALSSGVMVTDEAQAMELVNAMPLVIAGHPDNIKVTEPADCHLASLLMQAQHREHA